MNSNISALFVHDFKMKKFFKNFYKKSLDFNCKTCLFFSSDYFSKVTENYYFPILGNSNCKTKNCIYIIVCKLCGKYKT